MRYPSEKRPFCLAPWLSVQYGAIIKHGGTTPCCEWQLPAFKGQVDNYAESEYLSNIKEKMLAYDMSFLTESCAVCLKQEKFNIRSRRTIFHERFPNIETVPRDVIYFDYRPSNLCNLKCRMCNHMSSSQIAKEMDIDWQVRDTSDFSKLDFSRMETISVLGGEPSIDPLVHSLLDKLIANGLAPKIELTVTTNGTNINDRWKHLLSAFQKTTVILSIDATGPTYEYIRTNANWATVEQNCFAYQKHFQHLTYQIAATVLNIISIEDWLPWFIDSGVETTIWPVDGNEDILTLNTIPDHIREEKIAYLSTVDHPVAATVSLMLKDTKFEMHAYRNLLQWSAKMDATRHTNLGSISEQHHRLVNYQTQTP